MSDTKDLIASLTLSAVLSTVFVFRVIGHVTERALRGAEDTDTEDALRVLYPHLRIIDREQG